jgi:hypothetical protein
VYIHARVEIRQSQSLANNSASKLISCGQATGFLIPMARDKGNQNTEKPYAIPMHKCIANAAGGTNQRLKPSPAIVRSLANHPGCVCDIQHSCLKMLFQ